MIFYSAPRQGHTHIKINNEGYQNFDCQIIKNGDVMQDAALYYKNLAKKPLYKLPDSFILLTLHRAENTDDLNKLSIITPSINEIHQKMPVIWLIHPRTKQIINNQSIDVKFDIFKGVDISK